MDLVKLSSALAVLIAMGSSKVSPLCLTPRRCARWLKYSLSVMVFEWCLASKAALKHRELICEEPREVGVDCDFAIQTLSPTTLTKPTMKAAMNLIM